MFKLRNYKTTHDENKSIEYCLGDATTAKLTVERLRIVEGINAWLGERLGKVLAGQLHKGLGRRLCGVGGAASGRAEKVVGSL